MRRRPPTDCCPQMRQNRPSHKQQKIGKLGSLDVGPRCRPSRPPSGSAPAMAAKIESRCQLGRIRTRVVGNQRSDVEQLFLMRFCQRSFALVDKFTRESIVHSRRSPSFEVSASCSSIKRLRLLPKGEPESRLWVAVAGRVHDARTARPVGEHPIDARDGGRGQRQTLL